MRLIEVDPVKIWGFKHDTSLRMDLAYKIYKDGWKDIPPVPVFELPSYLKGQHDYILMDGNHRRKVAEEIGSLLTVALYKNTERPNIERHNLAPFKHVDDPKIYKKLIAVYQIRDKLPEMIERIQLNSAH